MGYVYLRVGSLLVLLGVLCSCAATMEGRALRAAREAGQTPRSVICFPNAGSCVVQTEDGNLFRAVCDKEGLCEIR